MSNGHTNGYTNGHHASVDVGFVGLGNMGAYMCANLLRKDVNLLAYDIDMKRIDYVREMTVGETCHIMPAENPADICSRLGEAATVITSLPSHPQVEQVYLAPETGLLATAQPGTLFIDCTTGDPEMAKRVEAKARELGCMYIDAPMSGGTQGAKAGTLTFMCGGNEKDYNRAVPVLDKMGQRLFYCGVIGKGLAVKICNNMMLGITMLGTSEVMNLGIKMGLDPKKLASIINVSTGRNYSCDSYNPVPDIIPTVPSSNNYDGGFGTALMAKDLGLAQNASTLVKAPTPLGSLAHQYYRLLENHGYGMKDYAIMYQFISHQLHNKMKM